MPTRKLPLTIAIGEDGSIIPIRRAARGLRCRCFCPGCGAALSAKRGKINAHHFAHHGAGECVGGVETALHRFAKAVLHHHRALVIPPVTIYGRSKALRPARKFPYRRSTEEVSLRGFVADVVLHGSEQLVVELKVTHGVDPYKQRNYVRAGVSSLEIDVLAIFRELNNEGRAHDTQELARRIINFGHRENGLAVHGRWLFHPRQHAAEYHRRKNSRRLKVRHGEWKGYHFFRTMGCPCPQRQKFTSGDNWSQAYARTFQDCIACPHQVEMVHEYRWVGYQWTPVRVTGVRCGFGCNAPG